MLKVNFMLHYIAIANIPISFRDYFWIFIKDLLYIGWNDLGPPLSFDRVTYKIAYLFFPGGQHPVTFIQCFPMLFWYLEHKTLLDGILYHILQLIDFLQQFTRTFRFSPGPGIRYFSWSFFLSIKPLIGFFLSKTEYIFVPIVTIFLEQ